MCMFCKHCGASLADGAKFCPSCGQPVTPETNINPKDLKNPFPKILIGWFVVLALLGLIGFINPEKFTISVINIILSLMGLFSVISLLGGIIIGILCVQKAHGAPEIKRHYNTMAIYSFVSPFVFIVSVILAFVVIRVIQNLRTQ